MSVTKYKGLWV